MITITARILQSAHPKLTPYFIRDTEVKGFVGKVNPSGSIKLIAEVRHEGRTFRKTIGQYPHAAFGKARTQAISYIEKVRTGRYLITKIYSEYYFFLIELAEGTAECVLGGNNN
ncbi:hypothetical protein LA52FAK_40100 [Desulforhopalus sp. 52FAK]